MVKSIPAQMSLLASELDNHAIFLEFISSTEYLELLPQQRSPGVFIATRKATI